jgi:hypothetical protein
MEINLIVGEMARICCTGKVVPIKPIPRLISGVTVCVQGLVLLTGLPWLGRLDAYFFSIQFSINRY